MAEAVPGGMVGVREWRARRVACVQWPSMLQSPTAAAAAAVPKVLGSCIQSCQAPGLPVAPCQRASGLVGVLVVMGI